MGRFLLLLALFLPAVSMGGLAQDIRDNLARGADPNARVKNPFGMYERPLHIVVQADAPESEVLAAVRVLLDAGADVNGRDDLGRTPLHWAVRRLLPQVARVLIARHADVNARDKAGQTPLYRLEEPADELKHRSVPEQARKRKTAAMVEMARLLLDKGAKAKLDQRDGKGRTALAVLARSAPAPVLETLLAAGARVDLRDRDGDTALVQAVRLNPDEEAVRVLLRHGARPDAGLMIWAIENGEPGKLRLLAGSGVDPDRPDALGQTPLMAAVMQARIGSDRAAALGAVRALLEHGADPSLRAEKGLYAGKSALDLAGDDGELRALLERGASRVQVAHGDGGETAPSRDDEAEEKAVSHLLARLEVRVTDLDDAEDAAWTAGDLRNLSGPRELADRIKALKAYHQAARDMIDFLQHGPAQARRKALRAGASMEAAESAARRIRRAVSGKVMQAMHARARASMRWAEEAEALMRLLQESPKQWQPQPGKGPQPRTESFRARYQAQLKRTEAAEQAMYRALERMLDLLKNGQEG